MRIWERNEGNAESKGGECKEWNGNAGAGNQHANAGICVEL